MTKTETTMYTLGQLARAIWPKGDMPPGLMDKVLMTPFVGVPLMLKTPPAKALAARDDTIDLRTLMSKLPANLPKSVKVEDQGTFWFGWYHYMKAIERVQTWGPAQLERAGRLLYGDRWQSELARALDINDRRVRQWMAKERPITAAIWADIAGLLRQRQQEGIALLAELDAGK